MPTNESMQNLLRLALGGAQRGLDVFQQQRAREPDLLLRLQGMLERRKATEVSQNLAREGLDFRKAEAVRQHGIDWGRQQMKMWEDQKREARLGKESAARTKAYEALAGLRTTTTSEKGKIPASVYNQFTNSYDKMVKQYNTDLAKYNMMISLGGGKVAGAPPTPPPPKSDYLKEQTRLYNSLISGEGGDVSGMNDDVLKALFDMVGGGQ